MRILMVRLGAMGDVVQTLPAAAELRDRFPTARIEWAVDSRWANLLLGNPHIDNAISVPIAHWRRHGLSLAASREAGSLVSQLRAAAFDMALDFQGLLKSALLTRLSGAPRTVGFSRQLLREPAAEVLYTCRSAPAVAHVVDRYRELASPGSGQVPASASAFPLPAGEPPVDMPDRFVLTSPQAGWGAKQWPADYYSRLASLLLSELSLPLVVDFAPGQGQLAEPIMRAADHGAVIPRSSSILGLIAATRRATAVVGVDSGPLHIAAALGKAGAAIFGPTDPCRNGPYGPTIAVLRAPGAVTTYKRTREPHPSMRACSPRSVLEALVRAMDG